MRPIGIVMLVVGVVLLVFGLNSTQAVSEKVVEGVTGRFTSNTMFYIISGIAMVAGGSALTFLGKKE